MSIELIKALFLLLAAFGIMVLFTDFFENLIRGKKIISPKIYDKSQKNSGVK